MGGRTGVRGLAVTTAWFGVAGWEGCCGCGGFCPARAMGRPTKTTTKSVATTVSPFITYLLDADTSGL